MDRMRILTVDDHPILRAGVAAMIGGEADMDLVGEAAGWRRRDREVPHPQA